MTKPKQPSKVRITFTAKPQIMEAPTKDALIARIKDRFGGAVQVTGSDGTYLKTSVYGHRIAYRLEKRRKKTIQTRNSHNKYHDSTHVRRAHWIAEVFIFTPDFPITIHQYGRCFSVRPNQRALTIY